MLVRDGQLEGEDGPASARGGGDTALVLLHDPVGDSEAQTEGDAPGSDQTVEAESTDEGNSEATAAK